MDPLLETKVSRVCGVPERGVARRRGGWGWTKKQSVWGSFYFGRHCYCFGESEKGLGTARRERPGAFKEVKVHISLTIFLLSLIVHKSLCTFEVKLSFTLEGKFTMAF